MVAASFLLAAFLHADMNSLVPSGEDQHGRTWVQSRIVGKQNSIIIYHPCVGNEALNQSHVHGASEIEGP